MCCRSGHENEERLSLLRSEVVVKEALCISAHQVSHVVLLIVGPMMFSVTIDK